MSEQSKKRKKLVIVPTILQMEALECGAACLTMILAYYKKWIPLEEVREACGISRDGSKASNIARAGKNYGLEVKAVRCELDYLKTEVQYPAIIHWNFNHFVVLCGFKGNKAVLNDPAKGIEYVSEEEFNKAFTGVCLQFFPTREFQTEGKRKGIFKFAKNRISSSISVLVLLMLISALLVFGELLEPGFKRVFTDMILTGEGDQWLEIFVVSMVVLVLFQAILHALNTTYLVKLKGKLSMISNAQFMWHVLRLPMNFFSQRMAGDLASRQKENDEVAETLVSKLAPVAIQLILLIFYVGIMSRYGIVMTVISISAIVCNLLLALYISKKRMNITRTEMRDEGRLQSMTVSGIEMIENIKASGSENGFFYRWSGTQAAVNDSQVSYSRVTRFFDEIPIVLQELTGVLVLIIGVYRIIKGDFTIGMLIAFQAMLLAFFKPADSLIRSVQKFQEMRSSMERIDDVMNYPVDGILDDRKAESGEPYEKLSGKIEMKNITFGYSKLDKPLLQDFNISIKPGSKVAIVGASGCGKSTLANLISGLYVPWSGEILFDGKHREEIPREVFTGSLAVVDQDITMFEGTVADNIKMWDETIEDFEMILAARDAQIHENIIQRENGYDTLVQEGGANFSGGERQRMEIARVLAQDPTIVIMDEATSALDAVVEYQVTKAIKDRGITCIIIAHRLSTIRDCDEILVLDKGVLVERGTHEELYEKAGRYKALVTME